MAIRRIFRNTISERRWHSLLPSCMLAVSRRHLLVVVLAAMVLPHPGAAEDLGPLVLERKIPLGTVRGRIDHLSVDLARQRLFVAELGNGSLGVVDLARGELLRRIDGLSEPQGVAYAPSVDAVFIASGGDGTLRRYAGAELQPLDSTVLGEDADNVRLDRRNGQLVVGYGSGALALIDPASGRTMGAIALTAHPESFRLETGGPLVYVNLPEARQVAVVDRDARRPIGAWDVEGRDNFPMALDESHERLLIVTRNPPELLVLDTGSGKTLARLATCGDADDVFLDDRRQLIYVSCGEGFVDVVRQHEGTYEDLARIPTAAGARTALFVPELDRLFVAVRAGKQAAAAIWVFRPAP